MSSELNLHTATSSDREFIYELKREAFQNHVELTFGAWDDSIQRARFDEQFVPTRVQIVKLAGQPIGMLELEPDAGCLRIRTIAIDARRRSAGIGTSVLQNVIARGKIVVLRVLKTNSDARRLYERLGFECLGDPDIHWWEMKREC